MATLSTLYMNIARPVRGHGKAHSDGVGQEKWELSWALTSDTLSPGFEPDSILLLM